MQQALEIDLTEEQVQTQQQLMLLAGFAIEMINGKDIEELKRKFDSADSILPMFRPSEWIAISKSIPLHIDLVTSFIHFRDAALRLRRAAENAGYKPNR